jgi:hypothetical protein
MKTSPLNASLPKVANGSTAPASPDENFGMLCAGAVASKNTAHACARSKDKSKTPFPLGTPQYLTAHQREVIAVI